MARVQISAQSWGVIQDERGNGLPGRTVTLTNLDATAATTWSAVTGGTSSTAALTTDAYGVVPSFIEEGSYTLTVGTITRRVEATSGSTTAVRVVVAAPTGVAATDEASWNTAKAAIDVVTGGTIEFRPSATAYVIRPQGGGRLLVPNNTTVIIPAGCTVQCAPNIATAAGNYVLFAGAATTPTNVRFQIDGQIDGNRRNGNHGLSEDIHAITLTDGQDCSVTGQGEIYNFRGEAVYFGHTTTAPKACRVSIRSIRDVGIKEVGDSGNPRQGVAFIAGTDCGGDGVNFNGVGGYCWDFEGNGASNAFDGCYVGDCTYRNVGQGTINFTTPGTISASCRMSVRAHASGPASTATTTNASPNLTLVSPTTGWTNGCAVSGTGIPTGAYIVSGAGTATMVMSANATASTAGVTIDGVPSVNVTPIPASRARIVRKSRASTDLTLNSATWADVSNTDFDITLPAQVGDIIRYEPNALIAGINQFSQFDVAVIVGGSVLRYVSSGTATPNGAGVGAWRITNINTQNFPLVGAVHYVVLAGDVRGGLLTLRLRYQQGAGVNQTLFASTGVSAALVTAENLGPGW